MDHPAYAKIMNLAGMPESLDQTAAYLAEHLRLFLKQGDRVLVCFPAEKPQDLGALFVEGIRRVGGVPVLWGPDLRWKTLLRLAFSHRASAVIGPPMLVLGLAKLAKATNTPLNIRHAVTAVYPCPDWMIDGIIRELDCGTWGCFSLGISPVVIGFSCGKSRGVHIREDLYEVTADGAAAPCALTISNKNLPQWRLPMMDRGRLETAPCPCGRKEARLVDMELPSKLGPELEGLYQQLLKWSSILDCRMEKGQYGLEMELVVFPGQKLPKLPSAAKRVIRGWNPEQDEPFGLVPEWEKWEKQV